MLTAFILEYNFSFSKRIYLGDRIKGEIEIILNENSDIEISKLEDYPVNYIYSENKIYCREKAGEYGEYFTAFSVNDIPVIIRIYQYNWYDLKRFYIRLNISENKAEYELKYNNENINGNFDLTKENIYINLN